MLRLTDPKLVAMQLDCGWATVAGLDPAEYLRRYPQRFELLHMKDVEQSSAGTGSVEPKFAELGKGAVDWKTVLAAARGATIEYAFVEIEGTIGRPPLESARLGLDYLRSL